jgi:hypothetical protein
VSDYQEKTEPPPAKFEPINPQGELELEAGEGRDNFGKRNGFGENS